MKRLVATGVALSLSFAGACSSQAPEKDHQASGPIEVVDASHFAPLQFEDDAAPGALEDGEWTEDLESKQYFQEAALGKSALTNLPITMIFPVKDQSGEVTSSFLVSDPLTIPGQDTPKQFMCKIGYEEKIAFMGSFLDEYVVAGSPEGEVVTGNFTSTYVDGIGPYAFTPSDGTVNSFCEMYAGVTPDELLAKLGDSPK